ncbi:phage head-tail adaptor, putative, SPP1 family [Schinkia azotoformans MEV2011]|uniref:Phage head-tail adaptor, putative, SPP1 family n=1 Tax=Schinkia azotoformans MEV2011 TaxID=1348973 RepID=A0A072NTF8_SCHAZ|nr:phage head closure protein [Schinkia azotoformans]KEF40118.1 phage head-tail adaptor, putative, SPP1 family [Schinkia azotoformans MEV2011]
MQPFKYNPNFNSGSFRHRITLQQFMETTDPVTDRVIKDWVDIKSVWSAIKTIKGSEYLSAATTKEHAEKTYRFVIRYTPGIDHSVQTRIKYNKRIFDIESILNDDEDRKTITIIAQEVI